MTDAIDNTDREVMLRLAGQVGKFGFRIGMLRQAAEQALTALESGDLTMAKWRLLNVLSDLHHLEKDDSDQERNDAR